MWNIDQFVCELNKQLPLKKYNSLNDKRKADSWSVRLVRDYFSKLNMKTIRSGGRNVYYNQDHIEYLKNALSNKELSLDINKNLSSYTDISSIINSEAKLNNNVLNNKNLENMSYFNDNQLSGSISKTPQFSSTNKDVDLLSTLNLMRKGNKVEEKKMYAIEDFNKENDLKTLKYIQSLSNIPSVEYSEIKISEDVFLKFDNKIDIQNAVEKIKIWLNKLGE